jgi:gluconate 2-dehydrogenase gamma chain
MSAGTSKVFSEIAHAEARCFFNDTEWHAVEAMTARIIPTTATPGAREAGAVCFIDRMLVNQYSYLQSIYREGLQRLNEMSNEQCGRRFAQLNQADQDRVLSQLEQGSFADWSESAQFFEMVRMHTIEGVLSDPKYGGNRDAVGWRGLL